MLTKETENLVAKLFINLFEGEKSVELARKNLANSTDFDAYQIFQRLDRERKNFIDEYNLAEILRLNKIYATVTEARLIISFYDSDYDGNLNYLEFLNMILSDSNMKIRRLSRENIGYKNGFALTYNMEYSLLKVLEKELELARAIEIIVAEMKSRYDFNLLDIYSLIQGAGTYISEASIKRFLIRSLIEFTEDELCAAFKRLDIDRDSRITFTEFKRLFYAASAGGLNFNSNSLNSNNILPSSQANNLLNSQGNKFDNSQNRLLNRSSMSKSPLKSSLRSCSKSPNRVHLAYDKDFRDKSPLKEKTESILNKSAERFSRSSYIKYGDIINNKSGQEEIEYYKNNNKNAPKNNDLLNSSTLKSSNKENDSNNDFYNSTNAFSNAKLSGSNFSKSPLREEYNSIISYEEENFNSFLKEILELENEIESAKFDLIIKADFNIEDAFRIFELSGRGYLTELDIKYGMNSLDIYPSKEEIALLIKRYDMTKEGVLNYNNFYEMLCPVDRDYRLMLEKRVPKNPVTRRFKSDIFLTTTRICFQDILRVLINVECRIESLRQRLNRLPRFDIREFFEKFDKLSKGYILDIDIINYLRRYDIQYNSKHIDYLFLRFDNNRDSRIQFNEFYNEMYPKSKEDFM